MHIMRFVSVLHLPGDSNVVPCWVCYGCLAKLLGAKILYPNRDDIGVFRCKGGVDGSCIFACVPSEKRVSQMNHKFEAR